MLLRGQRICHDIQSLCNEQREPVFSSERGIGNNRNKGTKRDIGSHISS